LNLLQDFVEDALDGLVLFLQARDDFHEQIQVRRGSLA
jgi:hypothetical protein